MKGNTRKKSLTPTPLMSTLNSSTQALDFLAAVADGETALNPSTNESRLISKSAGGAIAAGGFVDKSPQNKDTDIDVDIDADADADADIDTDTNVDDSRDIFAPAKLARKEDMSSPSIDSSSSSSSSSSSTGTS